MANDDISTADSAAQSLCTSCGLCCDGSIFRQAMLKDQDEESCLEKAGITPCKQGERRFFILPCHHLIDKHCQIYSSWRPYVCSRFKCNVLRRFYHADLSYAQALIIIKKAVQHTEEVRRQLSFDCFSTHMNLFNLYEAWITASKVLDPAIELNFAALQFRLKRDFKVKKDVLE